MDLTTLTDTEARDLLARVYADIQRRDAIAQAPAQAEALAATYAAAIGRKDGDPWTQPTGAHNAHADGAIVTHGGQHYRSTHSGNAWEPGALNAPWEPVWPDGDGWTTTPPAAGPLVWAVGISAVADTTVVSHEGRLWRCKVTHVTHAGWVPSASAYAVWTDIGPA